MLTQERDQLKANLQTELRRLGKTVAHRPLARLEIPLTCISPLAWLQRQGSADRFYWQDRDQSLEVAAVGAAHCVASDHGMPFSEALDTVRRNIDRSDEPLRYYGGTAFDLAREAGEAWAPLGAFRFLLPRFEVVRRADRVTFAAHLYCEDDRTRDLEFKRLETEYEALRFDNLDSDPAPPPLTEGLSVERLMAEPDKNRWRERVQRVLSALGPDLSKVVLACERSLQLSRDVDVVALLQHIRTPGPEAYQFLFQSDQTTFLGSSPECLYRREGRRLCTEAIAGTYRGKDSAISERAARRALLDSSKEMAEHDYVIADVESALRKICADVEVTQGKEVMRWNRLYHLRVKFSGMLSEGVSDYTIIRTLHPSAAVLGYPRPQAWKMLTAVEELERGWYAGTVGWIGWEAAEFAVAIRSALVRGKSVHIYAGAGIVEGSEAEGEWDEVRSKMGLFLEAFGLSRAPVADSLGEGTESVGRR